MADDPITGHSISRRVRRVFLTCAQTDSTLVSLIVHLRKAGPVCFSEVADARSQPIINDIHIESAKIEKRDHSCLEGTLFDIDRTIGSSSAH